VPLPPAPAAPPAPPVPAVKTGVSIPASHAASNRKPAYPAMSRRYGEEGTVVLRVLVRADGTAGQVEIKKSSGYPALDESAKSAVETWRFNPATIDGKPVSEWYEQAIPFTLQN
jgi:protein TonB